MALDCANPAPLGLTAFALCIFLLGLYETGHIEKEKELLIGFGFWFAGWGQVLANYTTRCV